MTSNLRNIRKSSNEEPKKISTNDTYEKSFSRQGCLKEEDCVRGMQVQKKV